jgi:hypothetical protein
LTSLATTLRNFGCASIGARRRLLNDKQNEALDRFLEADSGSAPMDYGTILVQGLPVLGVDSLDKLVTLLGLPEDLGFGAGSTGIRHRGLDVLEPDRGSNDIGEGLDDLLEFLGYGDPNVEQSFPANIFISRCIDGNPSNFPLCFGIFGILKTLDASVCYYREELGCGEKTCTKDLRFDVNYAAERLAVDFGVIDGIGEPALLIADILAPCGACIIEKSGGCSAFCDLYASYHSCDAAQTLFFENFMGNLPPNKPAAPGDVEVSPLVDLVEVV